MLSLERVKTHFNEQYCNTLRKHDLCSRKPISFIRQEKTLYDML